MKINPDIVFRKELNGEGVLFDPETGNAFFLNKTCVVVVEELLKEKRKEEILNALPEKIKNIPADVSQRLDNFLKNLEQKGILIAD